MCCSTLGGGRIGLLAVLAIPLTAMAQAGTTDTAEVRTAAVARRSIPATEARVTLQFAEVDSTPAAAGQRLAARADSVRRVLMALGIRRDSLLTGSRWYWWSDRMQTFTRPRCLTGKPGRTCEQARDTIRDNDRVYSIQPAVDTAYRAKEIMEVRTGDPALIGRVIDAALALRITDISNIQFSAPETRQAETAALREATMMARAQAETIAAAGGGRLGRTLSLSTQSDQRGDYGFGYSSLQTRGDGSGRGPGTEITAPAVVVSVTVYGRWQLIER